MYRCRLSPHGCVGATEKTQKKHKHKENKQNNNKIISDTMYVLQ